MKPRGCVTLVFDDGYTHIFDTVVPRLKQYNLPAVFAIPLDQTALTAQTGLPCTPWPQWLTLPSQFEIAAHTIHHRDLTHLPPPDLATELREPFNKLKATTIVYPGGATNDLVTTAARRYYLSGRTTQRGFEMLPPSDPLRLHTFNFTRHNFSASKANLLALWAFLTNSWLIETYHIVTDEPNSFKHAVRLSAFNRHLRFLTQLPIAVRTIRDVIRHYSHQK